MVYTSRLLKTNSIYDMKHDNNNSTRYYELQNVLDSPFNFHIRWGISLVLMFLLVVMILCFFVSTSKRQTLYAKCTSCQMQNQLWISSFCIESTDINITNGEEVEIHVENVYTNFKCSGIVNAIESNPQYIIIQVQTTQSIDIIENRNCYIISNNTQTLGGIIFSSIRKLL